MDKDNLFKAVLYAAVAFLIWNFFVRFTSPPPAQEPAPAQPVAVEAVKTTPGSAVVGGAMEEFVDLGNQNDDDASPYRMHLSLSTRGAAIASARLTDYAATVDRDSPRYELLSPLDIMGREYYSLETYNVALNAGDGIPSNDIVFQLQKTNWTVSVEEDDEAHRARFSTDLVHDGVPQIRVIKTYTLPRQDRAELRSDVQLELAFENLSAQPIAVNATQWGPVGIPQEDPRTDYRRITAGIIKSGQPDVASKETRSIEDYDLVAESDANTGLQWVAMANKFFAVIMAPTPSDDGQPWITDAFARHIADPELDDTTFQMVTSAVTVLPGERVQRVFDCYLGAKSKNRFKTIEPYASRDYVSLVNVDYYMCAWTAIVNVMLWLLGTVHSVWPNNYGLAIIVMVLAVRVMLHPLTKKGQVNMTRLAEQMQSLQPKIEEIRRKHEGDRQKINQETMKLYQTEGVNPAGQMFGCLPMFCQLPIWAALWAALQTTVELRHQPFILWINDLTAPDHFIVFDNSLPLIGNALNLLPPLLALSMWLQNKYMPKPASAGKTSEQAAQQKMMMVIMSVMMLVIFYNAPSGLTLYIMASNFFGLFEQWRIRKHIAEDKARRDADGTKPPRFQKPKWVQKLEKLAEDAKQQQQQQSPRNKKSRRT